MFCDSVGIWFAVSREEVARKASAVERMQRDERSSLQEVSEKKKEKMMCWLEKKDNTSYREKNKYKKLLQGGKSKKTPHLQHITIFSSHPSFCAFLAMIDHPGRRNK